MTASSGVVIAAASTVDEASPGAMSSPNVPTMIDTGRSTAHAGARSRVSRGEGFGARKHDERAFEHRSGHPRKRTVQAQADHDDPILCSSGERARRTAAPKGPFSRQKARVDQSIAAGRPRSSPGERVTQLTGAIQIPNQDPLKTSRFPQDPGQ